MRLWPGWSLICLLSWPVGLGAELFHPDTAILMNGPAYAAVPTGTGAVFLNPAGLGSGRWVDVSVDLDPMFRYNSIGCAVRLGRIGTAGLAVYRHKDDSNTHMSAGFGRSVVSWGSTNRPASLAVGLGFHLIREAIGIDTFSVDPGFLLTFGWPAGPVHSMSVGAATYGLFAGFTYRNLNIGWKTVFQSGSRRKIEVSLGAGLAHDVENRSGSFVLGVETWKDLFLSAGVWQRTFVFGFDFRGRPAVTVGCLASIDGSSFIPGLLCRLSLPFESPQPPAALPSSVKTVEAPKPVRISAQDAERQKILLQEGVDLYSSDRLAEAQKKWEEVLKISPDTAEGRQAQVYIRLVRNEIQRIRK
jgi:hypothetical protein